MGVFYTPQDGRCGDFIPFYSEGQYHLFHIKGEPWYHITTRDFAGFVEHGVAIPGGGPDSQDRCIFTGSVIEKDGLFHIFYTGHNADFAKQGKFTQVLMHATSPDLMKWTKDPDWQFPPELDKYGPIAWRDPYAFWNDEAGQYWIVLTAHLKDGPKGCLGCTALLTSEDLVEWEAQDPIWAPGLYDTHECPDLFKIGDWWYLIFSQYHDVWLTRYRMAKSPTGPWIAPSDDCFDGRAFYAAKTTTDGQRRFLVGWTSVKEDEKDEGKYLWGGCLMVHELFQRGDGTLGAKPPAGLQAAFAQPCELAPEALIGSWQVTGESITGDCPEQFGFLRLAEMPETCMLTATVKWGPSTNSCGLVLRADEKLDDCYLISIEPGRDLLKFDKRQRAWDYPWMERPVNTEGGEATLKVIVSGTVIAIYVNDDVALSGRVYDLEAGSAGLFVSEGQATFTDVTVKTMR